MRTTITIRTDVELRRQLLKRAASDGKSLSDLVRGILENAIAERTIDARAGHLRGRLHLATHKPKSWKKRLRDRNWRS